MNSEAKDIVIILLITLNVSTLVTAYNSNGPSGVEQVFVDFFNHAATFWLPTLALIGGAALYLHVSGGR